MYSKCPKCGFENAPDKEEDVCPQCGLVFDKWLKNKFKSKDSEIQILKDSPSATTITNIKEQLLFVPNDYAREHFYLNVIIYLIFFIWGWSFILSNHYSAELNESFMHTINLVFHEAGHVIFTLLGNFMRIIGGSLLQLIIPLVILFSLLIKNRDTFGASIGLWWFSQSMMDLVSYINDAESQEMWLLGGVQGKDMPGIHDWNNILSQLDLLQSAHTIATTVSWLAITLMIISFAWGALLLRTMYRYTS
jgi:hypothetical protein